MSPQLAAVGAWIVVLVLVVRDCRRAPATLPGLWLPILWVLILGSRAPAYWLVGGGSATSVEGYEEGNAVNQWVLLGLIASGLWILWRRKLKWGELIRDNPALFVYFGFAAISAIWADYTFVSLKGSVKAFAGNVTMVAIVLTDRDPTEAVKSLIRRCAFVLIPMSVLVIKYFPLIGRATHRYSYETSYSGVAVGSNGLATTCFVCGLVVVWSLVRKGALAEKKEYAINIMMLAMIAWLMNKADGGTALVALIMGAALMFMMQSRLLERQVLLVGRYFGVVMLALVPVVVLNYTPFLNAVGAVFGHSETLFGRLEVWRHVTELVDNPWIGAGYNSFWQGERLAAMWSLYWWRPTQAHNGYVETFANLGVIGVALLALVIVAVCRRASMRTDSELHYLRLPYLVPIVFFNLTEAAFRGLHLVFFAFLLFAIEIPPRRVESIVRPGNPRAQRVDRQRTAIVQRVPARVALRARPVFRGPLAR